MSVSVHVTGLIEESQKDREYHKIYEMCCKYNLTIPDEVANWVENERYEIFKNYMQVRLTLDGDPEYGDGAILDLSTIPKDVKKIRIYMS